MNVERVLIPTDLSEKSNAALESADLFIERFNCTVDLMHVIPLAKYVGESINKLGAPLSMERDVYPKLVENQRKELSAFANKHIKDKERRGEYIVNIDRKPSDSILKQIEVGKYDLVMMSAQGSHYADFFHGSATDKIVRRSKTPVLTLTEQILSKDIQKIVVPLDFSEHSMTAIPMAYDMAEKFDAELIFLNIIEMYAQDVHGIEPTALGVDESAVYKGLKKRMQSFLEEQNDHKIRMEDGESDYHDKLIRSTTDQKTTVECETVVLKSVAAHHEIVDYANDHADLVVMSTHGRSGFSRMLLGSTTEQVIQHLKIPQITIKPELKD